MKKTNRGIYSPESCLYMVSIYNICVKISRCNFLYAGVLWLPFELFLGTAQPIIYSENCNQMYFVKQSETERKPSSGPAPCRCTKALWNKREKNPDVQAAQIWAGGGFARLWSMTRAGLRIALCLECVAWQLAIKTSSVVMHGGGWRPEDLLSEICTYCSRLCAVMGMFALLQKVPVSLRRHRRIFCRIYIMLFHVKMV